MMDNKKDNESVGIYLEDVKNASVERNKVIGLINL